MSAAEEKQFEKDLPDWAVQELDDILGFTAPEMRRLKLLSLMNDLVMAADDTKDVE